MEKKQKEIIERAEEAKKYLKESKAALEAGVISHAEYEYRQYTAFREIPTGITEFQREQAFKKQQGKAKKKIIKLLSKKKDALF